MYKSAGLQTDSDFAVRTGTQWIKIGIPAIALLLGALQAIICRHTMDPDGMSYLDMGDALLRGDWQTGVNSYWSPLYPIIQASGLHVVHPPGYWQFSMVHFTNFLIYVLALRSFHFYWDRVMASHFRRARAWPVAWWLLGYALFTWATLQLITVCRVTPDLVVAALVFLASGLLVSIRTGKSTYGNFALLGLVLALGYLTKTAMFPLAFVFLGVSLLCVGDLRRAAPRVLLATTLFLGVTAPWIAAISHSKGRLIFGTTGNLTYAWYANGIAHWTLVVDVPRANLVHPARRMLEDPPVYRFDGPIKTSYPFWYDPSYWCEGLKARFQLRGQLNALLTNVYHELSFRGQLNWAAVALFFSLLSRWRSSIMHMFADNYHLWLPAGAALLMYALVIVVSRHVAPFLVLFWTAVFLSVIRAELASVRRVFLPLAFALAVLVGTTVALDVGKVFWSLRTVGRATPDLGQVMRGNSSWQVARGLQEMGVKPGDQVGSIGDTFQAYWARLAGVTVVAEIPAPYSAQFWAADAPRQAEAIQTFISAGAKVIVADTRDGCGSSACPIPLSNPSPGWRRIGSSSQYVYVITR